MAGTSPSLPVIDYSKLVKSKNSKDPDDVQISKAEQQKLYDALRHVGFVYLQNHSIPPTAQQQLFNHAKRFFAQPEAEKAKIETGESKAFHGWFSPLRTSNGSRNSDQKEAFDIGDDADPTRPNQWPADWPEFRTDMSSFFEMCHEVHLELLAALAEQVGLQPDFFRPYVQNKDHFFRVLYYPETSGQSFKNRYRASPHTDYGTLTLLFNDSNGGLQVRNKAGEYIDAPPIENAAIVNVGDLLARWFNDTLKSTEHRVIEPSTFSKSTHEIPHVIPARYAIAWFGHPNRDALIEPIESCCTPDHPKKYEPVYAGKHVVERLAKLHKDGKNSETWDDSMARDEENNKQQQQNEGVVIGEMKVTKQEIQVGG
jgi:hypothetical protein